jgi:hypothetical protein
MTYLRLSKRAVRCLTGSWKFLLPVLLLVIGPLRPAHAYIDPNTVGPLYQILLPMLIAIGSGIAMVRRYIREFWGRSIAGIASMFRRKPPREDNERLPP